jgi:IMP dehydrogenase
VQFGKLKLDIPILSANMDTITGPEMARAMYQLGGIGFLHRFCSIEDNVGSYQQSFYGPTSNSSSQPPICEAVVSLGVNEGLDRFHALYEVGARYFCVDIAHGHSKPVGHLIQQIKEFDDGVYVVAGNVCHATGAEYLADKGADAVKVGIGPGSACTTRVKTGFGVPQFTAIRNCRRVSCFIIADGGIKEPGDAVKAFAAGADAVMLGGMLAGCDETPGEIQDEPIWETASPAGTLRRKFKAFRGMASKEAADDCLGGQPGWKTAEGVSMKVDAKGPVADVIADVVGGIRSGMTYCGANSIRQIRERADWVQVTPAGAREGRPHGQNRL